MAILTLSLGGRDPTSLDLNRLKSSPLLNFFIDQASQYFSLEHQVVATGTPPPSSSSGTLANELVREFIWVCAYHISQGPDHHSRIFSLPNHIIHSDAARNPLFVLVAPLLLASTSLAAFSNSVLAFLRLLHLAQKDSSSNNSGRLSVARSGYKPETDLPQNVHIVGLTSRHVYFVSPNTANLDSLRNSLVIPACARFILDPLGLGYINNKNHLSNLAKQHAINFLSSSSHRQISLVHPATAEIINLNNGETLSMQDYLLGLISDIDHPFDDAHVCTILNDTKNQDIINDFIVDLVPSPHSKDTTNNLPSSSNPHLLPHSPRLERPPKSFSSVKDAPGSSVAIVGISCRLPGAEDLDTFWQNLVQGRDLHQKVPSRLFNIDDYKSASYRDKNTMRCSHMNAIDRPGLFDPYLFSETVETATYTDPQQRLSLMAAYEAMEMAAEGANIPFPEQAGVFVGACCDDYRENICKPIKNGLYSHSYRAHIGSRLATFFGFDGPAHTYDTACSSALVTIEAACSYLVSRKCSVALAGGVNVLTQPQIFIGLDRGFFLNSTGQCKTFDKGADGYCRSDAVGFFVLKRLEDARRDNDNILGVIAAASTNHSGPSYSITHPHAPTQAQLYRAGLASAKLLPNQLDYVECHGTGTQAGDAEEMEGMLNVFANHGTKRDANRENSLIVGSVKANLGHSESASGATALLKTLLAFQNDRVPTHIGIKSTINPIFPTNLADLGINIPTPKDGVPFKPRTSSTQGRVAMVNNFSAAGGNTSLIIHEDLVQKKRRNNRSIAQISQSSSLSLPEYHLFVFSAQTTPAFRKGLENLRNYLSKNENTLDVQDICYTLSKGRMHHKIRTAQVVSSISEIISFIEKTLQQQDKPSSDSTSTSPVSIYHETHCRNDSAQTSWGWLFTGQGSQWRGMGKSLYETSPNFKGTIDHIKTLATSFGFADFLPFMLDTPEENGFPITPVCTQLAIFALEYALAQLFLTAGLRSPSTVAGHSLGEYVALVMSGVLSLQDGVYLVGKRASLLEKHCQVGTSCLLAVQSDQNTLITFLDSLDNDESTKLKDQKWTQIIDVACRNSPNDTVLAGPKELVENLKGHIKSRLGARSMVLETPYAFHSASIQNIVEPFSEALEHLSSTAGTLNDRSSPSKSMRLLSNVEGKVIPGGERGHFSAKYLVQHARNTVLFTDSFDDLKKNYDNVEQSWIEVGPHPALSPMLKNCIPEHAKNILPTLKRNTDPLLSILNLLKSFYLSGSRKADDDVDFRKWSSALGWDIFAQTIKLPTYSFDQKEYWIDFSDRGLRDHLVAAKTPVKEKKTKSKKSAKKNPSEARRPRLSLPKEQPAADKYPLLSKCLYLSSDQVPADDKTPSAILELDTENNVVVERSIMGHKILGRGMAPATLLNEIAFQAGEFFREFQIAPGQVSESSTITVIDMEMTSSLIMDESSARPVIRVTVHGSWKHDPATQLKLSFSTRNKDDLVNVHHHATCTLALTQGDRLQASWNKFSHLVKHRVHRLIHGSSPSHSTTNLVGGASGRNIPSNNAFELFDSDSESFDNIDEDEDSDDDDDQGDVFKREMAYRLFGKLVDYSREFQGMRSVWLSGDGLEAATSVKLDPSAPIKNGFTCSPFLQDSIGQISGFIPNVGLADEQNVYIANGIAGVTFTQLMKDSQTDRSTVYSTYCRMAPSDDGTVLQGDVWIYRESDGALFGLFSDVRFKKLKADIYRRLMSGHHVAPAHNQLTPQPIPRPSLTTTASAPGTTVRSSAPAHATERTATPASTATATTTTTAVTTASSSAISTPVNEPTKTRSDTSRNKKELRLGGVDFNHVSTSPSLIGDDASSSGRSGYNGGMSSSDSGDVSSQLAPSIMEREKSDSTAASSFGKVPSNISSAGVSPDIQDMRASFASSFISDGDVLSPFSQRSSSASLVSFPSSPVRGNSTNSSSGSPSSLPPVFLLPDGSGCAAVYDELRTQIGKNREIFCLSSPFFRETEKWKGGMEQIIEEYEKEVLSARPRGPYSLGGWSFGGVAAYEVACRLSNAGHEIDSLYIIDSPLPMNVAPLSDEGWSEICKRIDANFEKSPIKTSVSTRTWNKLLDDIKEHFRACTVKLGHFTTSNLVFLEKPPRKTFIIHATQNDHFDSISTQDPNKWRQLFKSNAHIEFASIHADHFGIIHNQGVRQMSELILHN